MEAGSARNSAYSARNGGVHDLVECMYSRLLCLHAKADRTQLDAHAQRELPNEILQHAMSAVCPAQAKV